MEAFFASVDEVGSKADLMENLIGVKSFLYKLKELQKLVEEGIAQVAKQSQESIQKRYDAVTRHFLLTLKCYANRARRTIKINQETQYRSALKDFAFAIKLCFEKYERDVKQVTGTLKNHATIAGILAGFCLSSTALVVLFILAVSVMAILHLIPGINFFLNAVEIVLLVVLTPTAASAGVFSFGCFCAGIKYLYGIFKQYKAQIASMKLKEITYDEFRQQLKHPQELQEIEDAFEEFVQQLDAEIGRIEAVNSSDSPNELKNKDARGVLRAHCNDSGCDCDSYERPSGANFECSYCGHHPSKHNMVVKPSK